MGTFNFSGAGIQKIRVEEVVISETTNQLYDYSNRTAEIEALMESIGEIGQKEPIIVLQEGDKFTIVDGVLRLKAMLRLEINEINAIISTFEPTDQFSFKDYVIHHHIRKEKTAVEKLNEIKGLLRIDCENTNPLRDKEKRVKLVTALMGDKGWGRNNVFNLEKILRWEKENDNDLNMSAQVITNQFTPARALDVIDLFDSNQFDIAKEKETNILKEFLRGSYTKERAQNLIKVYDRKNSDTPTVIEMHPIENDRYSLILGNAEDVELPEDLMIDTVFTSPSYYKLRKYGDDPNELGWEETPDLYVKRLADILMKGYDKLKNTGSMFINIGETYDDIRCLAVIERLTLELINRGARFIDKLIWEKPSNKPMNNSNKRLKNSYEVILHFAKSKDYYFERFKINDERSLKVSKGCKEHFYNTKSFHIPNKYVSPSNFLSENSVDNILRIQLNSNRPKHIPGEAVHPATFPTTLPLIPLMISCPKTSETVVFDPFSGTSSTGVTALRLGFKFVGIELYESNISSALRILGEAQKEFNEMVIEAQIEDVILPAIIELDAAA